MSASAECSQLPSAVASQIHERHNYQREDTQRKLQTEVILIMYTIARLHNMYNVIFCNHKAVFLKHFSLCL